MCIVPRTSYLGFAVRGLALAAGFEHSCRIIAVGGAVGRSAAANARLQFEVPAELVDEARERPSVRK